MAAATYSPSCGRLGSSNRQSQRQRYHIPGSRTSAFTAPRRTGVWGRADDRFVGQDSRYYRRRKRHRLARPRPASRCRPDSRLPEQAGSARLKADLPSSSRKTSPMVQSRHFFTPPDSILMISPPGTADSSARRHGLPTPGTSRRRCRPCTSARQYLRGRSRPQARDEIRPAVRNDRKMTLRPHGRAQINSAIARGLLAASEDMAGAPRARCRTLVAQTASPAIPARMILRVIPRLKPPGRSTWRLQRA
jgi:hypothetical protein